MWLWQWAYSLDSKALLRVGSKVSAIWQGCVTSRRIRTPCSGLHAVCIWLLIFLKHVSFCKAQYSLRIHPTSPWVVWMPDLCSRIWQLPNNSKSRKFCILEFAKKSQMFEFIVQYIQKVCYVLLMRRRRILLNISGFREYCARPLLIFVYWTAYRFSLFAKQASRGYDVVSPNHI